MTINVNIIAVNDDGDEDDGAKLLDFLYDDFDFMRDFRSEEQLQCADNDNDTMMIMTTMMI